MNFTSYAKIVAIYDITFKKSYNNMMINLKKKEERHAFLYIDLKIEIKLFTDS